MIPFIGELRGLGKRHRSKTGEGLWDVQDVPMMTANAGAAGRSEHGIRLARQFSELR
jgi:hypothetical protein